MRVGFMQVLHVIEYKNLLHLLLIKNVQSKLFILSIWVSIFLSLYQFNTKGQIKFKVKIFTKT